MRNRKRGNAIVEAAITLPFFLLAIMGLSSIILMYSAIEGSSYIGANELRRSSAEAIYLDSAAILPYRVKKEAMDNHSVISDMILNDYGYRESRWGMDELIFATLKMKLEPNIPLGINAAANYDLSLVTRAYVGRMRESQPMTVGEMSCNDVIPVYIFPAQGIRYHARTCEVLNANYTPGTLDSIVQDKYRGCPICNSKNAKKGDKIYYFPSAGESYHLANCPSLERRFVEIDLEDAKARGYTPCQKCGGQ